MSASTEARWLSSNSARSQWQGAWGCGGRLPRSWRLRWGSAAKLPWIVRPPVPPDPDPEPGWPAGNVVGLNLGCLVVGGFGIVPLNLGVVACYAVGPQRRTYVVINTVSFVRLPDRMPIEVTGITLESGRSAWGWTFDFELVDSAGAAAAGLHDWRRAGEGKEVRGADHQELGRQPGPFAIAAATRAGRLRAGAARP